MIRKALFVFFALVIFSTSKVFAEGPTPTPIMESPTGVFVSTFLDSMTSNLTNPASWVPTVTPIPVQDPLPPYNPGYPPGLYGTPIPFGLGAITSAGNAIAGMQSAVNTAATAANVAQTSGHVMTAAETALINTEDAAKIVQPAWYYLVKPIVEIYK